MDRISGPGATPDNQFTEGNPAQGVPATTVTANWLNGVQEELIHILTEAGITPDDADDTQIFAALAATFRKKSVLLTTGDMSPDAMSSKILARISGPWVGSTAGTIIGTLTPTGKGIYLVTFSVLVGVGVPGESIEVSCKHLGVPIDGPRMQFYHGDSAGYSQTVTTTFFIQNLLVAGDYPLTFTLVAGGSETLTVQDFSADLVHIRSYV